jgi:hypothetical protein
MPGPPLTWSPVVIIALVTLVGGGAVGYAIGDSGSSGQTTTIVSNGGSEQQPTETSTETSTVSSTASAATSGEPIVLRGQSDQVFDQRSFSGDYKVTWSYKPNSSPFLFVDAKKTANPDSIGKTVVDTEAGDGSTFVHLDGDYYLGVSIGGKDYTVEFEPQ